MTDQNSPMPPHGLMGLMTDNHDRLWLAILVLWLMGLCVVGIMIYLKKQNKKSPAALGLKQLSRAEMLSNLELSARDLLKQKQSLPQDQLLAKLGKDIKAIVQLGVNESIVGMTNQELFYWLELKAALPAELKVSLVNFYNQIDRVLFRGEQIEEAQFESLLNLGEAIINLSRQQLDLGDKC